MTTSSVTATEVLVIGGGGAGLAAAIEAATGGRQVILLEKNPQLGGSTAWSVGSISVSNSPHQQRQGIADSADAHFEDLEKFCAALANRDNRALRRLLVDNITTALGLSPQLLHAGAILVNEHGVRFCDEREYPAHATARQPHGRAYVVFDADIAVRFNEWPNFVSTAPGVAYAYLDDYRRTRADLFHAADTLEAVAAKAGLAPEALRRTVHNYNADSESRDERPALRAPAFHVLGPVQAYVPFTDGGLIVNERLQVLDANDAPIAGLYAAGSNGQGGVILEGHGHHLGWAFVSGRIAGRNAAQA